MNETGILEVSPLDSIAGFTREQGGAPGEPDKYYPARDRNFVRLVPPDSVQAAALLELLQDERRRRLFIAHDEKQYGQALALGVARGARAKGIEVVKSTGMPLDEQPGPEAVAEARKQAAEVARSGADAFLYAGGPGDLAPLFDAVARDVPGVALLAPSAQADGRFAASLSPQAAERTRVTAPWLEANAYPAAARDFARRYRRKYGSPPPPQAAYGFEAMNAVLAAIRAAGRDGNDRERVIDEAFDLRNRRSPLGTYSIDRNGDTTVKVYGAYGVRGGRLDFVRVLDPLGA
jgi:branched-chain amino acid transport system substrate-binding protein